MTALAWRNLNLVDKLHGLSDASCLRKQDWASIQQGVPLVYTLAAQNRESAHSTIPRIAGWELPEINKGSKEPIIEWSRNKVESQKIDSESSSELQPFWPGPSAEMCRGFLLDKFWRILPGIFLEDFSGHFFSAKMRRNNPARKSAKKSGGPKGKIREKSVLPKTDPKLFDA